MPPGFGRDTALYFVVVVADTDDVGNVVVFLFLCLEEGILVIVVAEVDLDLVLDVRHLVAGALGLVVGLFQRDDLRRFFLGVELLLLDLFLFLDRADRAGN